MTQSEGNKQGSDNKRKTDMGDVAGKIGIIWCSAAIVWQVIDLVILHGADKLNEMFHMGDLWIIVFGITNAIFWCCALNICLWLVEIRERETITAGVQILGTVGAVVAARVVVWEYAQVVGRTFTALYYQEIARVWPSMFAWFIVAIIICLITIYIYSYIPKK